MAGLGVDNVSVFFLAEGEQFADEVMARRSRLSILQFTTCDSVIR
jgi:hypothetical protein